MNPRDINSNNINNPFLHPLAPLYTRFTPASNIPLLSPDSYYQSTHVARFVYILHLYFSFGGTRFSSSSASSFIKNFFQAFFS